MSKLNGIRTLTAVVFIAVVASACGTGGGGDAPELTAVTYRGPFVTSGGDAPFYYARDLGYYEELGIDLEIFDSRSSVQTVTDVASGGVDFGEADGSSIMLGVASGQEVVALASTVGKSSFGFYVPEDAGMTSIADLDGRSIVAIPPMETSMNAALAAAGVSHEGISPVFADSNALITTYLGGQVDALYTTALLAGAVAPRPSAILLQADAGFNPPDFALVTTQRLLADDPDIVRRFVDASLRGFQAAMEDPDAAIDSLLDSHPQLDRDQAMGVLTALFDYLCADSQTGMSYGRNAEDDWSGAARSLAEWAGLDGSTDASRFMTNEFFDGEDPIDAGTC